MMSCIELHTKTLSAPWLTRLTWDELGTLLVCLSLDFVEYIIPILMSPLIGDLLDLAGLVFCFAFFRWVGLISLLEIVPGLDVLPIYTLNWLVWYIPKRRRDMVRAEDQLDKWK